MAGEKLWLNSAGQVILDVNGLPMYCDRCDCNKEQKLDLYADILEIEQNFGATNAEKAELYYRDLTEGGFWDQYNTQYQFADQLQATKYTTRTVSTLFFPDNYRLKRDKVYESSQMLYFTVPLDIDLSIYKGKMNLYKEQSNLFELASYPNQAWVSGANANSYIYRKNVENAYITIDNIQDHEPGDLLTSVIFNNTNTDLATSDKIKLLPFVSNTVSQFDADSHGEGYNYNNTVIDDDSLPKKIYKGQLTDKKEFYLRNIITGSNISYFFNVADPSSLLTDYMTSQTYFGEKIGQLFAIDPEQKETSQYTQIVDDDEFPNPATLEPNQIFYNTSTNKYYIYDTDAEQWVIYENNRIFTTITNVDVLPAPGEEDIFFNTSDNSFYIWSSEFNYYIKLYSILITRSGFSSSTSDPSSYTNKNNIHKNTRSGEFYYYDGSSWVETPYDGNLLLLVDTGTTKTYYKYDPSTDTYIVWNIGSEYPTLSSGSTFPNPLELGEVFYNTTDHNYYYFDSVRGRYEKCNDVCLSKIEGEEAPSNLQQNQIYYNTTDGCYYGYKDGRNVRETVLYFYDHPAKRWEDRDDMWHAHYYPAYEADGGGYEFFYIKNADNIDATIDYDDYYPKPFNIYTEVRPVQYPENIVSCTLKKMDKLTFIKMAYLKPYLRYTNIITCPDMESFPATGDKNTLVYLAQEDSERYYRWDPINEEWKYFADAGRVFNHIVSGTVLPTSPLGREELFYHVTEKKLYKYNATSTQPWEEVFINEFAILEKNWNEYYLDYYFGMLSGDIKQITSYNIISGKDFPISAAEMDRFYNTETDTVYYWDNDVSDPWQESQAVKFVKFYLYRNPPIIGSISPSYQHLFLESTVKISNPSATEINNNISVSFYHWNSNAGEYIWANCPIGQGWIINYNNRFYKLHWDTNTTSWYYNYLYMGVQRRDLGTAGSNSLKPPPYYFDGSIHNIFWGYYADFPSTWSEYNENNDQVILLKEQHFDYQYGKAINDIQLRCNTIDEYELMLVHNEMIKTLNPLIKIEFKGLHPMDNMFGKTNYNINTEFNDILSCDKETLIWKEPIEDNFYYVIDPSNSSASKISIFLDTSDPDQLTIYRYSYREENEWDDYSQYNQVLSGPTLVDYINSFPEITQFSAHCLFYETQTNKLLQFITEDKWVQVPDTQWDIGTQLPQNMYRDGDYGVDTNGKRLLFYDNGWKTVDCNIIFSDTTPEIPKAGDYAHVGTTVYQYTQGEGTASGTWGESITINRRTEYPTNPNDGYTFYNKNEGEVHTYRVWAPLTSEYTGYGDVLPPNVFGHHSYDDDYSYYYLTGTEKVYRKTNNDNWVEWTTNCPVSADFPPSTIPETMFYHQTQNRFYYKSNSWYNPTIYTYTNINHISANPNIGDWWFDTEDEVLKRLMPKNNGCTTKYLWRGMSKDSGGSSYGTPKDYFTWKEGTVGYNNNTPSYVTIEALPLTQRQIEQLTQTGNENRWDYKSMSADLANIKGVYCEILTAYGAINYYTGPVGSIGGDTNIMTGFHCWGNPISFFQTLQFNKQYKFIIEPDDLTTLRSYSSRPNYNYYISPLVSAANRCKPVYWQRSGHIGPMIFFRPISSVYNIDTSAGRNLAPAARTKFIIKSDPSSVKILNEIEEP